MTRAGLPTRDRQLTNDATFGGICATLYVAVLPNNLLRPFLSPTTWEQSQPDDGDESAEQRQKDEEQYSPSPSPTFTCQDGSATTPSAIIGDGDEQQRRKRHHRLSWRIDDYSVRKWGANSTISSMWRTASSLLSSSSSSKPTTRTILRDIVGEACSGDFVAVLGPTGCGKTCLLDCLSLRTRHFTGALAMDGRPITPDFFRHTAYVSQVELFFSNLTVREHLTFHAINTSTTKSNHHHGNDYGRDSIKARVDKAMDDVGLSKVADCLIGGGVFAMSKGLSGGERKRLSVATGLLGDPSVILLDEPTSGLDVVMAGRIVESLSRLASSSPSLPSPLPQQQQRGGGRLVMSSFHSPSSHMVSHAFTHLLLLTPRGRLAYYGPTSQLLPYLEGVGLQCPAHYNPADFLLELVASSSGPEAALPPSAEEQQVHGDDYHHDRDGDGGCGGKVVMLEEAWAAASPYHHHHNSHHELHQLLTTNNNSHQSLFRSVGGQSSLWTQFCTNLHRNWRQATREHARNAADVLTSLAGGLIYGRIYYDQIHGYPRNTFGFFSTLSIGVLTRASLNTVASRQYEFDILMREYYGGVTSAVPFLLSLVVANLPFILTAMLIGLLAYPFVGLEPQAFGGYVVINSIFVFSSQAMGYLASSCTSDPSTAIIIVAALSSASVFFCGMLVDYKTMHPTLRQLQTLSTVNDAFSCMLLNEARYRGDPLEEKVQSLLGLQVSNLPACLLRLALQGIGTLALAVLALMVRVRVSTSV